MKKFKIILDITMTIMFIILMGYYITGNTVHEILGTITFVLFIIHNILNIKWYKSIFKGKHGFQRTFHIIINLLLFLTMIGIGVYSFISNKVYEDMFLLNDFKFYDYEQNPIIFYLKYFMTLVCIALVIYFIFKLISKIKSRKETKKNG